MLGRDELNRIAQSVLSACRAAGAEGEVWIQAFDEGLTRFANNAIHQNVAENNLDVTLRARVAADTGWRSSTASSNSSLPAALAALAENTVAAARLSPADPGDPGPAEAQPVEPVNAFDEATAACTPAQRAARANTICQQAEAAGLNAAGAYSTSTVELCAANSRGLLAYHPYTSAELQVTVMGSDSSGRGQGAGWRMSDVPVEALGAQAIQSALAGRAPRSLAAGEYPVILAPYAVLDIVSNLNMHGANGQAVHEGRSWMNGRLGQAAVSPLISLWDDGRDPAGVPLPFDGEGLPRQRVDILRQGAVGSPVFDRAIAAKAGTQSTGHALPPAMRNMGALAANLFMAPGQSSLADMIANTQAGLLITRFWYTRLVAARDCVITGMTRDGVFWVENGQVAYPVKNLRFTQSYVQALAEVSAVGSETPLLKAQYGEIYARVPALKVEKFRFTS